jgi:tripartite-type tricarboxylate transporter receptor subunit TctC
MKLTTKLRQWSLAALMGMGALGAVHAQESFPSQPIKLVLSYPPGGVMDPVARLLAPYLSKELGQPVVVENRAGASGTVGARYVARSKSDGHTILLAPNGVSLHPVTLRETAGYDVRTDLTSVSLIASGPYLLVVNRDVPANSVQDLVKHVQKNPGKVFYGTAGVASPLHLLTELFNHSAGVNMTHVPYQGNGPVVKALTGGEIQVGFDTIPGARALTDSGRLKILAVTTKQRNSAMPEVPTLEESGVTGVEAELWQGFFLPKDTPAPIVQRWNAAILKALKVPEVKQRMADFGFDLVGSTPEQLRARIDREIAQWERVVKTANIDLK